MRVSNYIRQHHLGMVAIFIALTGTAYAGNQAADQSESERAKAAKTKKAKPGPPGPQGPAGAQGLQGATGAAGSPDTGAQILSKLAPVDGVASGLDADQLDGLSSADYARLVSGNYIQVPVFVTNPSDPNCNELSEVGRLTIAGNTSAVAELWVCDLDVAGAVDWVEIG